MPYSAQYWGLGFQGESYVWWGIQTDSYFLATALKADQLPNIKTIVVKIGYIRWDDPNNTPRYFYVALPVGGDWVKFMAGLPALKVQQVWEYEGVVDGVLYWGYSGYKSFWYYTEDIVAGIDYNKCPTSVFQRTTAIKRDNWGMIERDISPVLDDHRPPLPNPAELRMPSYAEFEYIQQDNTMGTFAVSSLQDNAISFSDITLVNNDLVELVGETLPAGLSANKVYKVSDVSGSTCKLRDRVNYQDGEPVDITDNGSGTLNIKKADCFALHIKAEFRVAEDLELSNPVHYQLKATAGNCADTGFQQSTAIDVIDRYLSMYEAIYCGGIRLSASMIVTNDGDGTYHAVLPCIGDPSGYVSVNDEAVVVGCEMLQGVNVVMAVATDSITIDLGSEWFAFTFDPAQHRLYRKGEAGYRLPQWEAEDAYDYRFKPQSRDDASPQNNLTDLERAQEYSLEAPLKYPVNFY